MTAFWMGCYKSHTPKRHILLSNSPAIGGFDLGKLKRKPRKRGGAKTTIQYVDAQGRKCYKGTRNLKITETLGQC